MLRVGIASSGDVKAVGGAVLACSQKHYDRSTSFPRTGSPGQEQPVANMKSSRSTSERAGAMGLYAQGPEWWTELQFHLVPQRSSPLYETLSTDLLGISFNC